MQTKGETWELGNVSLFQVSSAPLWICEKAFRLSSWQFLQKCVSIMKQTTNEVGCGLLFYFLKLRTILRAERADIETRNAEEGVALVVKLKRHQKK